LVIFITKYGVISAKESANTNLKKEKFSGSQENKVRRVIYCKNASIYSMNSNQAENQTLKIVHCKKMKKKLSKIIF
jgi:hypothetical protein